MIVVWQLCRSLPTKLLQLQHEVIPGWNEVNTKLSPKIIATKIGYGPMIPSAPTDPSVVHKGIEYAVKLSAKLGLKHTIVTADQAIYDIAFSLREKAPDDDEIYGHLILMLGQFHLASNFNAAIGKLMRGSGGEEILAKSGICKLGTANKIFGPSGDYYQSMRAHKLLREAMARLHWEAFEDWYQNNNGDMQVIGDLESELQEFCNGVVDDNVQITSKLPMQSISNLEELMAEFDREREFSPSHVVWRTYIKMVDILINFTSSYRKGDWEQSLHEASNMLPYIISAGHHNYSYSFPLYLSEMNVLKNTAPEVWSYFMKGCFAVRRKDGSFNGVPADMALEQTYNKDAKESASGLSGITLDAKARMKWVYAKPITSEVSTQFRQMLNISERGTPSHHNEGKLEEVSKIVSCIKDHMINPFSNLSKDLMSLATGQTASPECVHDMCNIEKIGRDTLNACLKDHCTKVKKIKLHTFETMQAKAKKQPQKHPLIKEEVSLLKRIFHLKSSGMDVNLE